MCDTRLFKMEKRIVALENDNSSSMRSPCCVVIWHRPGDRRVGHPASDPTRFGNCSFKLKLFMGVLYPRYQQLFAEAEQSADPILNGTRSHRSHAQRTNVFGLGHVVNEGLGTWREFTVEWEFHESVCRVVAAKPFSSMVTCLQSSLRLNVWRVTTRSSRGMQWMMVSRWEWSSSWACTIHVSKNITHTQHCTVGQQDQDARRTLGNRAHATVLQFTASTHGESRPRARRRREERPRQLITATATSCRKGDNHPKQRQRLRALRRRKGISIARRRNTRDRIAANGRWF